MRTMFLFLICSLCPFAAHSQPAQPADGGHPPASVSERLSAPEAPVTGVDVVETVEVAASAVKDAVEHPTLLSIAGAIAAGLWCILAAVRRWGSLILNSRKIRWITLIIAPIATFGACIAGGLGWFDALVVAGGGPGALLLNELGRALKPRDTSVIG